MPRSWMTTRGCVWLLSIGLAIACGSQVSEDCNDPANASWCTGTEEGGACTQDFAEDATGDTITITIRNDRADPIWIPMVVDDCTWEPFAMWRGSDRVFWDVDGAWIPSCESIVEDACSWGCSDGPADIVRLAPGASLALSWYGYIYAPLALDSECASASGCPEGATCWAGRQLVDETLEARIRVWANCDWTDGTCDCGGDVCTITRDSLSVGALPTTDVSLALPYGAGDVVLAID